MGRWLLAVSRFHGEHLAHAYSASFSGCRRWQSVPSPQPPGPLMSQGTGRETTHANTGGTFILLPDVRLRKDLDGQHREAGGSFATARVPEVQEQGRAVRRDFSIT